jgi:hypothetical protein
MTPYAFTIYERRDNDWHVIQSGCGFGTADWMAACGVEHPRQLKLEVTDLGRPYHTAYAGPA